MHAHPDDLLFLKSTLCLGLADPTVAQFEPAMPRCEQYGVYCIERIYSPASTTRLGILKST
jgi:hypothetical protein